jgi:predicted permease
MGDVLAPVPRSSFFRYWTADAISSLGSAVTAVAMPVLVVQRLGATPLEVGVVNAAQFVPYALFGLITGVYIIGGAANPSWCRRASGVRCP